MAQGCQLFGKVGNPARFKSHREDLTLEQSRASSRLIKECLE